MAESQEFGQEIGWPRQKIGKSAERMTKEEQDPPGMAAYGLFWKYEP